VSSDAGRTIQFKLSTDENKADLDAYARSRGFGTAAAMARHAFYSYLAKCHYPLKTASISNTGSVGIPDGGDEA
jgi:hypothetical protein